MQQMAAADAPHLQEEEDYDQILPSCPIVVSEESFLEPHEEDPSLLLGADISESTWLGEAATGGDEDEGDHDEEEEGEGSLWGLPPAVAEILGQRGITQFYEWQLECLNSRAFLSGENFLLSLPTSGGKTLVAEIALLRCIQVAGRTGLLVLPYVSLVAEKSLALEQFTTALGFRTEVGVIVSQLAEEGRLAELGAVVVDELRNVANRPDSTSHMIGDGERGAALEHLLSKVLFLSPTTQIVGMSATIGNLPQVGRWLRATTYTTDFRPVPLRQMIKIGSHVFDERGHRLRRMDPDSHDAEQMLPLITEVIPQHSVLIFCPTKRQTEVCAKTLSVALPPASPDLRQARELVLQRLRASGSGVDSLLASTLPAGVAYHHSGLTTEEREIIEEAYRSRAINVLLCTSTLAAGVNLPARRVIIRAPYTGNAFLTRARYLQMVGRAGRAGLDEYGESILIIKKEDKQRGIALLQGDIPPALSQCRDEALHRVLLDALASRYAPTTDDLCTFMSYTLRGLEAWEGAGEARAEATSRSGLTPLVALALRDELENARRRLIVADELHLCYLVTPIGNLLDPPDWMGLFNTYQKLGAVKQEIGSAVGVREAYLSARATGKVATTDEARRSHFVCQRFFTALVLHDVLREVPLRDITDRYRVNRGSIQQLMQKASSFANMSRVFCQQMGWWELAVLMDKYVPRLFHGVKEELVPLVELASLKQPHARALFQAGYQSPRAIAQAQAEDLVARAGLGSHFSVEVAQRVIDEAKALLEKRAAEMRASAEDLVRAAATLDSL
ncbi:helicase domain containing protein [Acanthamoeba castellanii str. Neff]|uniref:Helicase domain containing protein n=1 Tax=Acanthamoeba castellanii (strain ATCC 30010 / Neff) TaxID=1257118 RepID=L8HBV4_ACACF|nr:helicase domain containing protein [Acanthamoeba castellanii str. Neff]ELR22203.1 helicase domain containing protein [Acanthamoeba castellanii str. Neff]